MNGKLTHTLAEVAAMTGFSERSLADDCRAGRIEHVHRGRDRVMTTEQIAALIRAHTVRPADTGAGADLDRVRHRVAGRRRRAA